MMLRDDAEERGIQVSTVAHEQITVHCTVVYRTILHYMYTVMHNQG
jgi:hypothetical protein